MFVYWGYKDSGKAHMKKYAKMNGKTVIYYDNITMRKIETHDKNIKKTIYYYDNEFLSEVSESKYNPNKTKQRMYIEKGSKRWNGFVQFGNKSLTHEMLLEHYDTIFEGGDIFLMNHELPEFFIVDNLTRLKTSCNNVVPYHTDLEHMYLQKLHYFGTNRTEEFGNNLMDIWNYDKDRIFDWLDLWEKDFYDVVNTLKKYDIPYQYFNLRTDSYVDTFGWKIDLDREFSNTNNHMTNIDEYKDIIRQYIQNRDQKEFQLL